jgi:hypothetical protein
MINENLADRTEGDTMEGKDLAECEPPVQDGIKTLGSPNTSDVLRRFDQDTTLVTSIAVSFVIVAAAVFGCEELVQTDSVRPSVVDTVRATDQPQKTQLTSSTAPEASYRSVETPASNPSSPRALSSQSNPIQPIATSQRSPEPVEELAQSKSKSLRHRTSMHHKVVDVKTRLLMLWHASLSRTREQARSGDAFWASDHKR